MLRKKPKTLRPVRPNVGIEVEYRRRVTALLDEANASVLYWLRAAWRGNEPLGLASDELPAATLKKAMADLRRRWQGRFDDAAEELARYFATAASDRSDRALRRLLREQGFSVRFRMTRAMRDSLSATVQANVALIKSVPQRYLSDVEGAVMRSVQAGRDLEALTRELRESHGVAKRRAAFIARDQNNKATAALSRVRKMELGVEDEVWMHSGGGKHPRPSHVKAGRERVRFSTAKGWWDPAIKKYIWPGTEPNCRCVSRAVIPGFV